MDDIVKAAIAKWPNVPVCRGWLGLDARGAWRLRDEAVQAAGPFAIARGSTIGNDRLRAFIDRNYAVDATTGCWYFQNGPQRADVELEAAPWVWRLDGTAESPTVTSHTGLVVQRVDAVWLDETGRLFLTTALGHGLVHTMDTALAADTIAAGTWRVDDMPFAEMPKRFGYVLSPCAMYAPTQSSA